MSNNSQGNEPHYRGSFFIGARSDMVDMFRRVHKYYDRFNHLFSFGIDIRWRRKSVKLLQFKDSDTVLDFGAGTGDFTITIRKTAEARIIALDLVMEMFDRFKSKLTKHNMLGIDLVIGDGETLPFPDGVFDGVVAGFVGRNLFDLELGLREILRVLKSGGRLGFLEFSKPVNPIVRAISWIYFRLIVAFIGNLFMPKYFPAYSYLIDSVERFYTVNELSAIFKKTGFTIICPYRFNLGTVILMMGEK